MQKDLRTLGLVFLTQLTKSPKFLSANYSVNEIHDVINVNSYCMDLQNHQNEKCLLNRKN